MTRGGGGGRKAVGCFSAPAFIIGVLELWSGMFTGTEGMVRFGAALIAAALIAPFIIAKIS